MGANLAALDAGHAYGETAELPRQPEVLTAGQPAPLPPGRYRTITGVEALAYGLVEGGRLAGLELFYGSYPITPASGLLHALARLGSFGVRTFQAEDEIAAVCAAIGASYAGKLGVTGSSGAGIALKTEALGLAIATELPLVVIDAQRGGPSTGLPTKTEQSDLFQAVLGRNADSPLVGARRGHARRLLRRGDRGRASRRQVHDPGDAADRRLPRQCQRALAGPRPRPDRALPGPAGRRSRDLRALHSRDP
jgi:2-oxoglutarate/2-oxoacid ferredoxin oxidoreductase subunit alpha